MTKGMAAMMVYTTKECNYNFVIVHLNTEAMTAHANQGLVCDDILAAILDLLK